MSDGKEQSKQGPNQQRVIDLNVNGHLMSLDVGLYCIYHAPGQQPADEFGFPGLRISLPPFQQSAQVSVETFENDGWLGAEKSAALIRVSGGPGLILVTVYQNPSSQHPAPKLQVVRLNDAPEIVHTHVQQTPATLSQQAAQAKPQPVAQRPKPQEVNSDITVFAHVQAMGDITVQPGNWIGVPDSKTWIEGFGLNIKNYIQPDEIEYQAVLGKGWMSPWYKGNQFCGSRGMALPLCGLRIKLGEDASKKYHIRLSATFIDGTKLGPIEDDSILSAESVAPLEAIRFELVSVADGKVVGASEVVQEQVAAAPSSSNATIRKIVPAKPARSNVKLKNTAAKAAAAKAAEQKATTKKNK